MISKMLYRICRSGSNCWLRNVGDVRFATLEMSDQGFSKKANGCLFLKLAGLPECEGTLHPAVVLFIRVTLTQFPPENGETICRLCIIIG